MLRAVRAPGNIYPHGLKNRFLANDALEKIFKQRDLCIDRGLFNGGRFNYPDEMAFNYTKTRKNSTKNIEKSLLTPKRTSFSDILR
jgi:hypothetical protein